MTTADPGRSSGGGMLVRGVRLVAIDRPTSDGEVDLRIRAGAVTDVGVGLRASRDEVVLDGEGRWAIPGLWDTHVHLTQWALQAGRIDTSGTASAEAVLDLVRARVAGETGVDGPGAGGDRTAYPVLQGYGHRTATWPREPTVAQLDAVSAGRPVVLVSGDAHHGWLNSPALQLFGLAPRAGVVAEDEWFPIFARLGELAGSPAATEAAVRAAVGAAQARGIVGIVDLEWGGAPAQWQHRYAGGLRTLRVRAGVYADGLDAALAAGRRSGDPLVPGCSVLEMGPLKVISDGSLNTRTAFCHEPYVDADAVAGRGAPNLSQADLVDLMRRATAGGLQVAIHAIGDAALDVALDAFAVAGAAGSIEHAQLISPTAPARMAALGLTASIQPAHLWDDLAAIARCWPDRDERCYAFRALLAAGVPLALGSDAPVSPLDPWLAIAAAVHRSPDERPPRHPEQSLTAREALAASVDGQGTLRSGSRADLVLLEADPLAGEDLAGGDRTAYLRRMPCAVTIVAGEVVHGPSDAVR